MEKKEGEETGVKYSIRDMADLLHISREMIRYYERWGILSPERNETNNYRNYSPFDLFSLMDAIQYRSWGIPVKSMRELRQGDFLGKVQEQLSHYADKLRQEAAYKQLLLERIEFISARAQTAHLNMKNYWVKQIPAHYFIPLIQGEGDHYGPLEMDGETGRVLFSEQVAPFWNPCFEETGDHQLWGFHIDTRYFQALEMPPLDGMRYRPAQNCLCSMIDLGPVGEFRQEYAKPAQSHLREIGLEQGGALSAVLLGRGVQEGRDVRIMELHIPLGENTL